MQPDNIPDDGNIYVDIDFQRPGEPIFDFWARVGTHFAPYKIYRNRSAYDNSFLCRVFAGGLISNRAREVLGSRLPHLTFEGALRTAEFLEASDDIAAEEARLAMEAARMCHASAGANAMAPDYTAGKKRVQAACFLIPNKRRKQ